MRRITFLSLLLAGLIVGCGSDDTTERDPPDMAPDLATDAAHDMVQDAFTPPDMTDIGIPDVGSDARMDTGTAADMAADAEQDQADSPCDQMFSMVGQPLATPPFSGTAYITNDLLTEADPTSFVDLNYQGQGSRTMFDRRVAAFITLDAHLFDAEFGANKVVEIQVNPEFTAQEAEVEARYYAASIGRIPGFLFRDVDTVWIHKGLQPFGGGNRNLLIHTEQGEDYAQGGSLEEIFIHEASHTSMDAYHASAPRWLEAQTADGVAISTYARDNPTREDVAESLGPYLAAKFRPERIPANTANTILQTMPNRALYFDCLDLSMDILQ